MRPGSPPHFHFIVLPSHEAMSRRAAGFLEDEIRRDPSVLVAAASGSTPSRTYELLTDLLQDEVTRSPGLLQRLRIIKLDEWGGLTMDDPATCETNLKRLLVEPLGISPERYFSFQSDAGDPRAECGRIARALEAGGPIGVSVLGLGLNGHLGFNEPAEALEPFPHVAQLSASSLAHPMLERSRASPRQGLTLGIADILRSRRILLLVSGSKKREVLRRLLEEPISPRLPASFLWTHGDVTCLCDREAAEGLEGLLQ